MLLPRFDRSKTIKIRARRCVHTVAFGREAVPVASAEDKADAAVNAQQQSMPG